MKKVLAKTTAVLTAASLLASAVMPVLADTATNDTTGSNSENVTNVSNVNDVKVTNVSDAYIKNEVKTYSNTGHNSASKNTMGGMVQTGDAVTDVSILNDANINTNVVDLNRNNSSNTAGNSITGADSKNYSDILNKNRVKVKNDNTAVVKNKVTAESNTGENLADKNTDGSGGVVQSGDAQTMVSLSNRANDSATSVSGLANFGANVVGNSVTGFNSDNVTTIKNLNDVLVNNVSDAYVRNKVKVVARTGRNTASKNTMGGMVQSGDAGAGVELLSDANINTTSVENGMGGNQSTSGNSITGADSGNFTDLVNKNSFRVFNYNNKGMSQDAPDYQGVHWGVENVNVEVADTGGNLADKNTYPSSISSGIASIGKFIRVCLNDTMTSIGGSQ